MIAPMAAKARKKNNKHEQAPRAVNKKAYRDYELVERFEAGLALLGTEVKSLRAGQADLDGSYARVDSDQCWLVGGKIAQYNTQDKDKARPAGLYSCPVEDLFQRPGPGKNRIGAGPGKKKIRQAKENRRAHAEARRR
jgi:hypothetical protein